MEVLDTAPSTLLCLKPEERKKILLESLQAGYPCIPSVSRPVSSKVSRYVSQFTSGRWRERIWFSDDSDEDVHCEMSTSETKAPRLVIFGYDLHCDDFLKEREMIARWNIVERELHFPYLEKGYVQKRDAKTQSDVGALESCQTPTAQDADIVQEPTTEDIPMEECHESPQKVTKDFETSLKVSGQESSIRVKELEFRVEKLHESIEVPAEVVEQASEVQESKPLGQDSKAHGEIPSSPQLESAVINSEFSVTLKGKEREEKMATVPEDSKAVGDSCTDIEAIPPEETSLGKESVANSETSVISEESTDVKEVSNVPDLKLAASSKMKTSDAASTESGDKISVPKLQFLAALEVMESTNKMVAGTVLEDYNVSSSEKVMETSETISSESSSESVSVLNSESSVEPTDKMDNETVSERSEVSRTSETDVETSGTISRGKRKADSLSEDDPDEKRTKKTSVE